MESRISNVLQREEEEIETVTSDEELDVETDSSEDGKWFEQQDNLILDLDLEAICIWLANSP